MVAKVVIIRLHSKHQFAFTKIGQKSDSDQPPAFPKIQLRNKLIRSG